MYNYFIHILQKKKLSITQLVDILFLIDFEGSRIQKILFLDFSDSIGYLLYLLPKDKSVIELIVSNGTKIWSALAHSLGPTSDAHLQVSETSFIYYLQINVCVDY
jgi:hypothetical protein